MTNRASHFHRERRPRRATQSKRLECCRLLGWAWLTPRGPEELTGTPPALSHPLCQHFQAIDRGAEEGDHPCRKPLVPPAKIVHTGNNAGVPAVLSEQLCDLRQVKARKRRLPGPYLPGFPGRELSPLPAHP